MLTTAEDGRIIQVLNCFSSDEEGVSDILSEFSLDGGRDYVYNTKKEAIKYEEIPASRVKEYKVTLIVEEVEK